MVGPGVVRSFALPSCHRELLGRGSSAISSSQTSSSKLLSPPLANHSNHCHTCKIGPVQICNVLKFALQLCQIVADGRSPLPEQFQAQKQQQQWWGPLEDPAGVRNQSAVGKEGGALRVLLCCFNLPPISFCFCKPGLLRASISEDLASTLFDHLQLNQTCL